MPSVLEGDGDSLHFTDADGVSGAALHGIGGVDVEECEKGWREHCAGANHFHRIAQEIIGLCGQSSATECFGKEALVAGRGSD